MRCPMLWKWDSILSQGLLRELLYKMFIGSKMVIFFHWFHYSWHLYWGRPGGSWRDLYQNRGFFCAFRLLSWGVSDFTWFLRFLGSLWSSVSSVYKVDMHMFTYVTLPTYSFADHIKDLGFFFFLILREIGHYWRILNRGVTGPVCF